MFLSHIHVSLPLSFFLEKKKKDLPGARGPSHPDWCEDGHQGSAVGVKAGHCAGVTRNDCPALPPVPQGWETRAKWYPPRGGKVWIAAGEESGLPARQRRSTRKRRQEKEPVFCCQVWLHQDPGAIPGTGDVMREGSLSIPLDCLMHFVYI